MVTQEGRLVVTSAGMELGQAVAAVVNYTRVTKSQTHIIRCSAHVSYPMRSSGDKGRGAGAWMSC